MITQNGANSNMQEDKTAKKNKIEIDTKWKAIIAKPNLPSY